MPLSLPFNFFFALTLKRIISILANSGFLALGIWLSWLFLQKPETAEAFAKMKEAETWPLWFIVAASLGVYILRALRWQQLLAASGEKVGLSLSFSAVAVGYLVSFGLPRFGEVVRCYILKKKQNIGLAMTFGTVVAERAVDILMLLLMLLLSLLLQMNKVLSFFTDNIVHPLTQNLSTLKVCLLLTAILLAVFALYWGYHKFKNSQLISSFASGLATVFRLEKPWLFVAYTASIWLGYYLMTWLWFFLFPATAQLGLLAGLTIFTIGTVGRSVPIQGGGMGAYHFLVGQALVLYGCSPVYGASLAMLIHGGQTIFTFLAGLPALAWVVWRK